MRFRTKFHLIPLQKYILPGVDTDGWYTGTEVVDCEVYEVEGRVYAVDPLVVDSVRNTFNQYHFIRN